VFELNKPAKSSASEDARIKKKTEKFAVRRSKGRNREASVMHEED
jgi:hypothetical protein